MLSFFGKILIFFGFLLILIGSLFFVGEKIPFFGKLPGDIYIKRENFTFYFPIATCLILSLILSLIFYFLSKFFK
ncbi:DUF2905 domain-containing protein [Candidatus Parcubacteria bacterium]|nr:DUF2905 domain-containing protein [Candidatus Parcubacteria bacterium]